MTWDSFCKECREELAGAAERTCNGCHCLLCDECKDDGDGFCDGCQTLDD